MITYKTGSLLEASEKYIGHGVNAQGQMGSGVAKAVREKWPEAFQVYRRDLSYRDTRESLGTFTYIEEEQKVIINLVTQRKIWARS